MKTALITGGTGGLGRALAPLLIARGYQLGITYLIPAEAETLETELQPDPDQVLLRRVDSSDPEAVTAFAKDAAERFGSIDALVALVGGWAGGTDVEDTDDVRFERMLDLNLRSTFYSVRAVLPYLREVGKGRIVTVGSRAAIDNPYGQAAFNVAKAGVVALTKSVANELRGTEITANALLPSVIDTPATREAMPYADYVDWPTPAEIAGVIAFMLSDEAAVMNGATVPVYGNT
ncbi:MAG: SDR family oxidoreductase [Acidimicrobiia bacterium]|nr:SDR family oxidoreductase [Acidimicrobiia bacterium]MBT8193103.1 SDR family oxidoreductase [Acidimicrobiia bacterium]NNF89542.1 SDR family oxidoreductase [Acidimicrobiia bacterium]NNJ48573.1 SDR family oxidoreductase [Acidimicrobiia bacterium]NNL14965.1 SDR family oxidoreductase [Acidimicrobiia bacterium]